jgi:hypothetical protein
MRYRKAHHPGHIRRGKLLAAWLLLLLLLLLLLMCCNCCCSAAAAAAAVQLHLLCHCATAAVLLLTKLIESTRSEKFTAFCFC